MGAMVWKTIFDEKKLSVYDMGKKNLPESTLWLKTVFEEKE